ncbi:MAG: hypothetical protein ISS56_07645 [Anaerolineae bacterium]|nr:hypothetical protein [Anaerolineae bacterium]
MSTLYRAQILLEPEQHRALADIARREGRSLSDLVREILAEHLSQQDREAEMQQELEAIHTLAELRAQLQAKHGIVPVDPLAGVRNEREEDVAHLWSDGG